MSRLIFVDDPFYQGKPPIPQTIRAYAMRALFKSGVSIGDIARRYGTTYHMAYKTCNPPAARQSAAESSVVLQPAASQSAAETSPESAADAELDAAAASHRRSRPGRPIKTHTRSELKAWTIEQLKRAVTTKGLQPGTYADALTAELDAREPGWYDNL